MLLVITGHNHYTGCQVGGFASIIINISIVVITILIKTIKTLSTVCKMLLTELSLG